MSNVWDKRLATWIENNTSSLWFNWMISLKIIRHVHLEYLWVPSPSWQLLLLWLPEGWKPFTSWDSNQRLKSFDLEIFRTFKLNKIYPRLPSCPSFIPPAPLFFGKQLLFYYLVWMRWTESIVVHSWSYATGRLLRKPALHLWARGHLSCLSRKAITPIKTCTTSTHLAWMPTFHNKRFITVSC